MGTLHTKRSQNLSTSPPIDASSYLLGKNQSSPGEKTSDDFDINRLNFIPDSEQQWNSPLTLRLPRTAPVLDRSPPLFNRPIPLEYSTNMSTQQKYKCDQCGMIFPSNESLFKHKTRFCIGVKDSGIGRRPIYSDDEDIQGNTQRSTTRKVVIRHHSPVEKKREEVNDWKRQRSILQTVEDMEDRILTDTHQTQKLTNNIKKQDHIYNEILLEYERLQTQEREILRQMYNLQIEPTATKYPNIKLKEMIDLNDNQKSQLEELQRKNLRLERERRVIQRNLEELISTNYQPTTKPNYEPYRFLREMKEQHELNEKALNFLRGRYIYHNSSLPTVSDIPSLPYVKRRYTQFRRTGGDNVRSFRNSYLQTGSHDANVIAHNSDIEHRLRAYEDYPWTTKYPEPLRQNRYQPERPVVPQPDRLKLANEENQRLLNELHDMHQKFETLTTRTRQLEYSIAANEMSNSIDHQSHLSARTDPQPQASFRDNNPNHQTSLPVLDKRITPRASPAMSLLASNMNKLRDPLAPQPYDPIGGFIIFFDFVVSLPSTIDQCSLVTCLYHPKSGLGEPSQLEPFKCEQYMDERHGERMSVALIATKQPVPRCPPQQALTVVIEVQTLTNQESPNEELRTSAWTKLPLFDNKNRLLSGRWKVPLTALPIHHAENLAIISTLPKYERAELHYRLVNFQDGEDQSHAPLSPSFRDLYIYPLQYRK